jgi:hypothetical protein
MPSKDLVPVTFRLTEKERAQFRIWCIQQGSSVQKTLAAFAKSKIRKVSR